MFSARYGTEIVILSKCGNLANGIITPGTVGFFNRKLEVDANFASVTLYYIDVFQKGLKRRKVVKRIVVPKCINTTDGTHNLTNMAFGRVPSSINGNPYKLVAFMRSILDRNESHKYRIYASRMAFGTIGINKPFLGIVDRMIRRNADDNILKYMWGLSKNNVQEPDKPLLKRLIKSAINDTPLIKKAPKSCPEILIKYESILVQSLINVKHRHLSLSELDANTSMLTIHTDKNARRYHKFAKFMSKSTGELHV